MLDGLCIEHLIQNLRETDQTKTVQLNGFKKQPKITKHPKHIECSDGRARSECSECPASSPCSACSEGSNVPKDGHGRLFLRLLKM